MEKIPPKYVIIQSNWNNRYLHFYSENPEVPNALRFDGEYNFDLDTRFELVPATKGDGLVHIRSLRNNKYWANSGAEKNLVTAMVAEPEENQSDRYCTLFRPVFTDSNDNYVLRLLHINTGNYVSIFHGGGLYASLLCLLAGSGDVCTFLDWESVVVLPDVIRIKADTGNYLRAFSNGFMDYNIKADNSSMFDYEVIPSRNGGIRLKSVYYGTYWTDMDDGPWVVLKQADPTIHESSTVFLPTLTRADRIIIRSLRTGLLCNSYTAEAENKWRFLAATETYTGDTSFMEIEEPVISRHIDDVRYHLTDARIYDVVHSALIAHNSCNPTRDTVTSELDLKTTVSNITQWSTSVSLKAGVQTTLTIGVPLMICQSNQHCELEISADVTKSTGWGETETEMLEVSYAKTINVQPMCRVKGTLLATMCRCDIPFSYTQRDVMKNGSIKVSIKDDGLFSGRNSYNYRYEVVHLPLE